MPQVALLGVHPALAVLAPIVCEEPVEHGGVTRREVAVHALAGHPGVQRDDAVPVRAERPLGVRHSVLVGPRSQPQQVLVGHQLARRRLRHGGKDQATVGGSS